MKHCQGPKGREHILGVKKKIAKINENLRIWYCKAKEDAAREDARLTKNYVQAQARKFFEEAGIKNFSASDGWYRRWITKWKNETISDDTNKASDMVPATSNNMCNNESHQDVSLSLSCLPEFSLLDSLDSYTSNNYFCNSDSLELTDIYSGSGCSNDSSNITQFFESLNEIEFNDRDPFDCYHIFKVVGSNEATSNNTITDNKLDDSLKDKAHSMVGIKKGQHYLPHFKQKVLEYASNHTYKETALKYQINCNTVTEWIKENKRLQLFNKSTIPNLPDCIITQKTDDGSKTEQQIPSQRSSDLLTADQIFLHWVQIKRKQKEALSREEVYETAEKCLTCKNKGKPAWFMLWIKRFDEVLKNSVKPLHKTEPYIKYSNNFKLEIALYAKIFTKNSAARVFNIPRRRVFDWYNELQSSSLGEDSYEIINKANVKQKVEDELMQWYQSKLNKQEHMTSQQIQLKAKSLFCQHGFENVKCSEAWFRKFCARRNIKVKHLEDDELLLWILSQYDNNVCLSHQNVIDQAVKLTKLKKGSKGWILRFLKRHSNLLQIVPQVEEKLPERLQEKIESCLQVVQDLKLKKYGLSSIGCMDEVPISFLYHQDQEGKVVKKIPLLRKTGFEQCQAIVLLSMCADGFVLPPLVVFKGSGVILTKYSNVYVSVSKDGSVNDEILNNWVQHVWFKHVSTPNMLLVDSYNIHQGVDIKSKFNELNSDFIILPEGSSSHLQPVNGVSKLFQEYMNDSWTEYMRTMATMFDRKCQCPSNEIIVSWIEKAYGKLLLDTFSIINSFSIRRII